MLLVISFLVHLILKINCLHSTPSVQAKYLAQIIVLGAQVVGRAFTRALKQEVAASQEAAKRRAQLHKTTSNSQGDLKLGISLEVRKY